MNTFHLLRSIFLVSQQNLSMSGGVLKRPHGDGVAAEYGDDYFIEQKVRHLQVGQKFEVLCDDRRHYRAEIKQWIDSERCIAVLHFCQWSKAYDFKGCMLDLYLAPDGLYSGGLLTEKNTYRTSNDDKRSRKKGASDRPSEQPGRDYFSNTKYSDDFLSKPRMQWRRSRDSSGGGESNSISNGSASESDSIAVKRSRPAEVASAIPNHILLANLFNPPAPIGSSSPSIPNDSSAPLIIPTESSTEKSGGEDNNSTVAINSAVESSSWPSRITTSDFPQWILEHLVTLNPAESFKSTKEVLAAHLKQPIPRADSNISPYSAYNAVNLLEARAAIDDLLDSILQHHSKQGV